MTWTSAIASGLSLLFAWPASVWIAYKVGFYNGHVRGFQRAVWHNTTQSTRNTNGPVSDQSTPN